MNHRIPQQAEELNRNRAKRHAWHRVLIIAACVVVFCTTYALILPAITLEKTAYCGYEEHVHSDACYTRTLICGLEETETAHQHTDDCYQTEDVLTCELPEGGHIHEEACYDEQGQLSCQEEEGHIHTAECYQAQPVLICGMEETGAAHVHTDACYEEVFSCQLPEHEHTLICYSDPTADRETADVWERSVSGVELRHTWTEDVISIAQSQLGYDESEKNYIVTETGAQKGITRYGQWYGDDYGDWCAMFVSFCLRYAGIPGEAVPYESSCPRWQSTLTELKLFQAPAQHTPRTGDIVFFDLDDDGEADHVGLVEALEDATRMVGEEEERCQVLHTIEGNSGNCVQRQRYDLPDDKTVLGYVPLELAEHSLYQCGMLSHQHGGDCTDAAGTVTCQQKEHIHDDSCLTPRTQELTYEDDQIALRLHVEGEGILPEDTRMEVRPINAGDEDYQPFADYAGSKSAPASEDNGELAVYAADAQSTDDNTQMIVRSVTLLSDGKPLDTTGYTLTAEVEVKPAVIEPMLAELAAAEDAAPEAELGVVFTVLKQTDGQPVEAVDSVLMQAEDAVPTLTVPVSNGVMALEAGTPNPSYTVQYYAYIPRFAQNGDTALTVIDTSGGQLPSNGGTLNTKPLYLNKTNDLTALGVNNGQQSHLYQVKTESTLTPMYTSGSYQYIKAPNPAYVNKLIDNPNYVLKEVWVLKGDKDPSSPNQSDWDVYSADIHFTNRQASAGKNNVIYIADGTVIRLVYDVSTGDFTTPANFYDYDITNGEKSGDRWISGGTEGKGINSSGNYAPNTVHTDRSWELAKTTNQADVLAFGNANCGTGLANYKFNNVYLNRYSTPGDTSHYGCTFGLAKELKDNKIVYNEWLCVPHLFNDGTATGKTTYDQNSDLTFTRSGDTYTLSSARVNGRLTASGLQNFFNPSPNNTTIYDGIGNKKKTFIATNNFWPMDQVSGKDPKFGRDGDDVPFWGYYDFDQNFKGPTSAADHAGTFPVSDDGNAHNSFFGMQYALKFTLSKDYIGPLEYYFFGDDDMWVFLDSQLVCDIGGVHSSVGEYVNLWDYINRETVAWDENGEKEFTLTFFYTERGASGSTCYMNFTLPSVSGINLEQKTGELKVQKQLVGETNANNETDADKGFTFKIRFYDANGAEILDDYAYNKYGKEGNQIGDTDLIIHDGSSFTLEDGQYIIIKYLPFGIRYTVTEAAADGYTVSSTVNGVLQTGNEAKGTIIHGVSNTVLFTNTIHTVGLTLQKLDIDGTTPLAGAVFQLFQLRNKSEELVSFISGGNGVYTAPTQTGDTIDTSQLYYIALAKDPDYVVGQAQPVTDPYSAQLQEKVSGALYQQYKVYRQDDGSYSFQLRSDNRWLDLDNGTLNKGTMIHFWQNSNSADANDCQKWFLTPDGNGYCFQPRKAVIAGKKYAMDLSGGDPAKSDVIQLWEKNNTDAQRWLLVPVETPASQGESTTNLTVDSGGILRLSGLFPGDYTLEEITPPPGYQKLTPGISLTVDKNGTVTLKENSTLVEVSNGDGSGLVLKVRNRPADKQLTLTKVVSGSDTKKAFTFTITYTLDGEEIKKTVSLENGASTMVAIPHGATVTIREENHDGFSVSFDGGRTTLTPQEDGSVTFTITENVTITATNTAGYALPETGGSGAAMYLAAGLLLMGGSALALCLRRRKEAE